MKDVVKNIIIILLILVVIGLIIYIVKPKFEDSLQVLDGDGMLATDTSSFRGMTYTEWSNNVNRYMMCYEYINAYGTEIHEDENGNLAMDVIVNSGEIIHKFVINKNTGMCKDETGNEFDIIKFINNVKPNKGFEFNDKQIVAMGLYIQDDNNWEDIAHKYVNEGIGCPCFVWNNAKRFFLLVIPKDLSEKVSVYSAKISDDGEIIEDELLGSSNEPFIGQIEEFEYIPNTIVVVENKNGTYKFPITFSGFDGSVNYGEHSDLVCDISQNFVY